MGWVGWVYACLPACQAGWGVKRARCVLKRAGVEMFAFPFFAFLFASFLSLSSLVFSSLSAILPNQSVSQSVSQLQSPYPAIPIER